MTLRNVGNGGSQRGFEIHHPGWITRRTGWSAMLLFVVAAIAGLVGMGQLRSSYAQGTNGSIDVEYSLLARYHSLTTFLIHVRPAATQGKVRLYFNKRFVENIDLRKIEPRPESVAVGFQSMIYTFNVPENSELLNVTYQFEPNSHGKQTIDVGIQDGTGASFSQFIIP